MTFPQQIQSQLATHRPRMPQGMSIVHGVGHGFAALNLKTGGYRGEFYATAKEAADRWPGVKPDKLKVVPRKR